MRSPSLRSPALASGAFAHTSPGQWTPHVTLGRRIAPDRLADGVRVAGLPAEIVGSFAGLRHWDGDTKREYPI
jgi:hypothetical protein